MILFRLMLVAGAMTVAVAGIAAGPNGPAQAQAPVSGKQFTDRLPASAQPIVSTARPAVPRSVAMKAGRGDALHAGPARLALAQR